MDAFLSFNLKSDQYFMNLILEEISTVRMLIYILSSAYIFK